MNTTNESRLAANPVFLYMTPGADNKGVANTTFNVSGNVTSKDMDFDEENYNYESYILYNVTLYMSEYLWLYLVLGVPGNVASIFTIMSMSTVSSSKAHVAILALTDTVAIVAKVIYSQVSAHRVQLTVPGCAFIMFIQQFSTCYANWVVVAMTTERFLAVWFPLRVGRIYTRRKAFIVLACLAITTSAVYLFFFWSFTEHHQSDYGYWCEIKSEYRTFLVSIFYWVEGFYSGVLPCLFILVGNVLIITNIKRARKAQRHLTNAFDQGGRKARDQRQITVMLIVVSVVFLLLTLPGAVLYFAKKAWVFEEPSYEHVKYLFTSRLVHLLADANHAVNFYLYFLSMSSFRRRFLDAIRCRRHMRRRPAGSSMSRTSQTYIHSGHHISDPSRLDSTSYSAYKRSSSKFLENAQPLKALTTSNNNRTNLDHPNPDQRNGMDNASSDV